MAGEHAKITTPAAAYCGICGKSYDRDTQTGRDGAANRKENNIMSTKNSNKLNVPEAKAAMDQFKMQAANEVGVDLKNGYNGHLTSREAGSVGGQMVKKMIESYEKNL